MISCAEMQFDALYLEQFLPKIACEIWVTIKNNRVWHDMKLEDLIHEYLSHCGCCKQVLKGAKMSILGKVINNHHDDGFVSDLGKPVIKSIEISFQIAGGIGSSCSVPDDLTVSPLLC
jgi:hypothetical protein